MIETKYKILFFGNYTKENISITYKPEKTINSKILEYVNRKWLIMLQNAEKKNVLLYNSSLFRLIKFHENNVNNQKSIAINLGDTDYKMYATLREENQVYKSNPIGTHIILVTHDGYIPLVKRSEKVDVNPGKIFTFGGFFEKEFDWFQGKPDPFLCIQREVKEEIGISIDINLIILIGMVYDNENPHPEISFTAHIPQTKKEISLLPEQEEWKNLFFIKVSCLKDYLNTESEDNFTPTLLGGLHIFTKLYMS